MCTIQCNSCAMRHPLHAVSTIINAAVLLCACSHVLFTGSAAAARPSCGPFALLGRLPCTPHTAWVAHHHSCACSQHQHCCICHAPACMCSVQATLQQQGLLQTQTLPAASSPRSSSWHSLNLQDNSHAGSAQHASTYAASQHEVHIREPAAIRQAVARLSLDGGGRRLTGGPHGYSTGRHSPSPGTNSSWLISQPQKGGNTATWQGQAPAGPEEALPSAQSPRGFAGMQSNRHADLTGSPEGQLLAQLQRHAENGRSLGQGDRPASTAPFLQDEGQRYGVAAGTGSSPTMLQAWQARQRGSDSHHGKRHAFCALVPSCACEDSDRTLRPFGFLADVARGNLYPNACTVKQYCSLSLGMATTRTRSTSHPNMEGVCFMRAAMN
jgi:hypothetical protein